MMQSCSEGYKCFFFLKKVHFDQNEFNAHISWPSCELYLLTT